MTLGTPKLPPSSPAKAVALFLLADLSLVGLVIAVILESDLWIALFSISAVLFFAGFLILALRLGKADGRSEALFSLGRMGWSLAATFFWSVAVGLSIFALGYGIAIAAPEAGPLLIYGLVFIAIVFVAWSGAKAAIRRRRMLLIISHIEKAISMNLPIPRILEAAAKSEQGAIRQRLLALHDHLDRGESLDMALIYAVPEVPVSVTRAIAAGQRMNCLGHVLQNILRRNRRTDPTGGGTGAAFYWSYPIILIAVICLIMIAVIPKYEGIFRDFHLELPRTTRLLLAISRAFADDYSILLVVILFLALVPLGRALGGLFPFFRITPPFDGAITDQLFWWTPFLGGAIRDRGMADLCDLVSAGVHAGYPLNDSLREAASAQANAVLRYRATAWADAVSRGQPMHEAARYARMPQLFTAMLATVRNDQSLLQVLGFLWRSYEFRFSRASAIAQAAYVPIIVLFFGTLVAFIGCSLMLPITALMDNLAIRALNIGGF
jgi:type II secretory pathway component PulF